MITVIANLKGGTGKSTVTFNLAVWLGSRSRRTAVIDLDPQRTLTDVAALRMEEGIEPAICAEAGSFSDVTFPEDAEEIIIDVGTADLESFKQAVMIADRILIPVTPSQADIWSTQRFIRFLHKNTHGNPPESITFLNRVDTRKASRAADQAAAALSTVPVVRLIPQRLSDRAVYQESLSESLAVFELEPRSTASREFTALAEALFPDRQRSVSDRLRKQKTSTAADPAFRQMLETPSDKSYVRERSGYGAVKPASSDAAVQQDWSPEKEQEQKDTKKHKTREGKKNNKLSKEKSAGKEKKSKKDKGKKRKKNKK
jgi:chromosome partitioning protein